MHTPATPQNPTELDHAAISAVMHEGLTVTGRDGRPARLAIIDEAGNVLASGEEVAREAWNVTLACHRNFLQGLGHLRVHSAPPGLGAIGKGKRSAA